MAPDPRFAKPVQSNVHFDHPERFTQAEAEQIVALVAACSQGGAMRKDLYKYFKKAIVTSLGIQTHGNKRFVYAEYHGVFVNGKEAPKFEDVVAIP